MKKILLFLVVIITISACTNKADLNKIKAYYDEAWHTSAINYSIGRIGYTLYLIDSEGNRVGGGYHSYFKKDGIIYGKIGNNRIEVVVNKNGDVNQDGGIARYQPEELRRQEVLYFLGDGYRIIEQEGQKRRIKHEKRNEISNYYQYFFIRNNIVYGQLGGLREVAVDQNGAVLNYGGFNE